jgi:peptide/nickel transport system permease protein
VIVFIVRRVAFGLVVLWAVASLSFAAMYISGDPVTMSLEAQGTPPDEVAHIVHELGFDRPFIVQYGAFLARAVRGDFGMSFNYGVPSSQLIEARVVPTLELAAAAVILTLLIGIPLGALAARHPHGIGDRIVAVLVSLGQSVPSFVIGPILILVFAVEWKLLPFGSSGFGALVLPAITLAIHPIARITRVLRSSVLQTSGTEFVKTARAKGLSEWAITWRHILRNALLPTVTIVGLELTSLVGGAVVVENIFGWQGLGTLTKSALLENDRLLALGCIVWIAAAVVVVGIVTDCLYTLVDPRVKLR